MKPCIVMMGDSISGPGGIAAVARTYLSTGFFRKREIVYLSNYEGAGPLRQIGVVLRAALAFLHLRLGPGVTLMHIHSASRGSFWRAALFSELAAATGVPFILHIHSGEFPSFFDDGCGPRAKAFVRRVFRRAAGVLCLTPGWRATLQPLEPQAALAVLPNPVDVPDELPPPLTSPARRLLFLGKLTEKKGLFDLFQAMPHVVSRFPNVQLVVAGDGDINAARECAKHWGIDHAVIFEGWVDGAKKCRCLSEATIVVVPSHFEAFGMSILEAMTYGKPVVATSVGGVPEVLMDGQHGRLVAPHDPQAIASALVELLADEGASFRMGIAGFHHARDNYKANHVTEVLGRYYDSLLLPPDGNNRYLEKRL
jgi:glycosyltransferase involved in cell wall biosynthesis